MFKAVIQFSTFRVLEVPSFQSNSDSYYVTEIEQERQILTHHHSLSPSEPLCFSWKAVTVGILDLPVGILDLPILTANKEQLPQANQKHICSLALTVTKAGCQVVCPYTSPIR